MKTPLPQVIQLDARDHQTAHRLAARIIERRRLYGIWVVQVLHDDGCRAAVTQSDTDCRPPCKPDFVLMDLAAHRSFLAFDAALREREKARWN